MGIDLTRKGSSSGGGSSANPYLYKATNYTDLVSTYPTATIGDVAYVYNSQGTAWLPGSLGGTYYPNGVYVFNGTTWVSDRNAISNELQNLIDDKAELVHSHVISDVTGLQTALDEKLDKPTITTVSGSSYTVLATDSIIYITSTTCTITMPLTTSLTDNNEFTFFFNDCDLTLQRQGSDLIDNETTWTLKNTGSFNVTKIGTNIYKIS